MYRKTTIHVKNDSDNFQLDKPKKRTTINSTGSNDICDIVFR